MKRLLIPMLCCMLWLGASVSVNAFTSSDTTSLTQQLDSAFRLMKRTDPQAVPFLNRLLVEARESKFRKGEGEALFCLGEYYSLIDKLDPSRLYFDSALVIFAELNYKKRLAQTYNMLGTLQMMQNQYAQSIPNFKKAAEINLAAGRKQNLGDCYYNLGIVYSSLGDYAIAVDYFINVLKLDLEIGYKEGIAGDYERIASMYVKTGNIPKALENYKKSLEVAEASGDKKAISSALTAYGLGLKNLKLYGEAQPLLERSLSISMEEKSERNIAIALHNLGSLHNAQNHLDQALTYYQKSMQYPIPNLYLENYKGLAEVNLKLKKYPQAIELAGKALQIANESQQMGNRKDLNLLLANIFEAQGNHQQALQYYKVHAVLKDSLLDADKSMQVQNLQVKYESEKQSQEIAALTTEGQLQASIIRQKNFIQYALVSGLVVITIFGFITFRIFRGRQEARRLLLAEQVNNEHRETERLKEMDRLKSRFFANVAHEFRTPLTLILGPVENLINESKDSTDVNQLSLVRKNATRLTRLVNQLLELSKLEAGNVRFDYVTEDIIPFLKGNTYAFQSTADQKKISIQFTSSPDSLVMQYDRDKLEKIFSNLLSNAFKFTPEGGTVCVQVNALSKALTVRVTDTGTGIPEGDLPYVFNRFYQSATATRSTTGSGIGLELTKELVELCGGSIMVLNRSEGGAQFEFTLPIVATASETSQQSTPYVHAVPDEQQVSVADEFTTSAEHQEVVLVIEDNEDVCKFIVDTLRPVYRVETAADGGEGISKALDLVPDLIITDVMMPVKDGMEVCSTLKQATATSHVPIIMLTARADIESKIEGLQLGADDYLAKPFHTKELLTRIENLISLRKKLRDKFTALKEEPLSANLELPLREKNFLSRLNDTIMLHLADEAYSVEMLSSDMAMSRMQLHRKVKALTNTSTNLYMRSIRLVQGKRMLEEGLYNVSEVAYRVGFNSATWFSTCFAEAFGFPPSDVKRK